MISAAMRTGRVLTTVALAALLLGGVQQAAGQGAAITVQGGFATPESVLYDASGDIYLVTNINGNATGADGNGFISRVRPDGRISALKWIDGTKPGVALNAPKGMAIRGDTLFVADITTVRMFDRRTGQFRGSVTVPGATFLNDAAAAPDGTIYVTDSGLKPDFSPSGTDAVYRIDRSGALGTVARGAQLKNPNGVAVLPDGRLVIAAFSADGGIYRLTTTGQKEDLTRLPGGQLDGVEVLSGGVLLVSSWAASAVFRVAPDGAATRVIQNVKAPADIGYDRKRNRVLIPLFQDNRVLIQPLR
ncbi:MAG TPA: SMP-30/gluconolactonase/LRE family protein [bacterium]|jgi:DNA-binding beta-propeller fold protein YncE|nr:SMP-30/gluconolactonase/LRE family protein [bacterium]